MKKINRLMKRIDRDHAAFKAEMLNASAEGIYNSAYEICIVEEMYGILTHAYTFSDEDVRNILHFKGNILEQMYQGWLDGDYSGYDQYEDAIRSVLGDLDTINELRTRCHKAGYKLAA